MTNERIEIIKLPPGRWRGYKGLRLRALNREPLAFAVSASEVNKLPSKIWQGNLVDFQKAESRTMWFAQAGKKLVGMAGAYKGGYEKTNHVAVVHSLYVDPAFRQQGLGERLVQTIIEELSVQWHMQKVRLEITKIQDPISEQPAFCIYRKMGFEVVGNLLREYKVGEDYYDVCQMEKYLGG